MLNMRDQARAEDYPGRASYATAGQLSQDQFVQSCREGALDRMPVSDAVGYLPMVDLTLPARKSPDAAERASWRAS